jgi:hypothetical protein
MAHVFVSHAGADAGFVDKFVERILTLGLHLTSTQIFYSSDRGRGVPTGQNLLTYVRDKVTDADLVIAVVSPMFQTRPVCVAELGAAWSRAGDGKFFPVAIPGMKRTDMEGVMEGVLVLHLDNEELLDELAKAVCQALDVELDPGDWTKYKAIWLAEVGGLTRSLGTPEVVTREEHDALQAKLAGVQEALVESANEAQALKAQIERYRAAGDDPEKRRDALLPDEDKARFELLRSTAAEALSALDPIVREVIFYEIAEGAMPWPNAYDDRLRSEAANAAVTHGDLTVTSDDQHLVTDESVRDVKRAWEAVRELRTHLEEGGFSEAFADWFVEEYGAPAQLARRRIWDQLLD